MSGLFRNIAPMLQLMRRLTIKKMSKTKNNTASAASAVSTKSKQTVLSYLEAMCKSRSKTIIRTGMWLLLAVGAAMLELHASGSSYLAMLYMIAENGKKSGRADGNVYMRNGRIRGMSIPRLVQNGFTQAVRSAFGSFSAAFRSLGQAQQNAWNSTKGFFKSDRFARQIEISGKTLFVMLNQNLFNIGESPILDPPAPEAVPGITALEVTATVGGTTALSLAFDPAIDASVSILVEATPALSNGVNRPGRSAYRVITVLDSTDISPASILTAYVARLGAMISGTKVFVRLTPINATTGQSGASIVAGTTVSTTP